MGQYNAGTGVKQKRGLLALGCDGRDREVDLQADEKDIYSYTILLGENGNTKEGRFELANEPRRS